MGPRRTQFLFAEACKRNPSLGGSGFEQNTASAPGDPLIWRREGKELLVRLLEVLTIHHGEMDFYS
jgi:hypothetical protein